MEPRERRLRAAFSSLALQPAANGAMLGRMPTGPRPVVDILRFIAEQPVGRPIHGADIPGLEAAGGQACIAWLADRGLIDATVSESACIIRGITEYGEEMLARAG